MKKVQLLKIIQQFEKSMVDATQSLNTELNNSSSVRVMREIHPNTLFPTITRYLESEDTKTKSIIISQDVVDGYVKGGWTLFLYWYKKKWKLNCHLSAQATFEDWRQWLEEHTKVAK